MSKRHQKIREALCELIKSFISPPNYGVVKSVDEKKRICSVQISGILRENVLLYTVVDDALKGFCFVPKVGSKVVVTSINDTRSCVSMFSEIDKVLLTIDEKVEMTMDKETLHYKNDKTELKITNKGFTIKKDSSGLLKTLTDLCDALAKLTVTTAMGASGIPINVADFTKIKADLKKYLEG